MTYTRFLTAALIGAAGALCIAYAALAGMAPAHHVPTPLPAATVSCGAYEVSFTAHDAASISDADEAASEFWSSHACREYVSTNLMGHEFITPPR